LVGFGRENVQTPGSLLRSDVVTGHRGAIERSLLRSGGKHWPSRCYRKETPTEGGFYHATRRSVPSPALSLEAES